MKLYLLVSSFLNCAGPALLGVSVLFAGRRNPRNRLFSLVLFAIALWSAFYWLWRMAGTAEWALWYSRALMVAAVFIPVTVFHFISRLVAERYDSVVALGYGIAIAAGFTSLTGTVVERVDYGPIYGYWPVAGPLFPALLAFFGMYALGGVWLAWKHSRQGDTPEVRQLRYFLLAVVVGYIGGATNFPLWFGVPIPPVGNGVVLVYTAMMVHAILKYRLPAVNIDLAKGVVYSGLVLTLAVFYVVLVAGGAYLTQTPLSSLDLLRQFLVGLLVTGVSLWLAPKLRAEADRLMEQTLMKGRYLHRTQLRELANRVFSITDEDRVFTEAAMGIARGLHVDHAVIYFRGEIQAGFARRAAVGLGEMALPAQLPPDHPLALLLEAEKTTIVCHREEIPAGRAAEAIEAMRAQFGFEALVPIPGHRTLLGFVMLGRPRREGFFDDLDLSLVETIAVQIGLAVRSRQLERRANQTESLISLGTLAAGLAHELRNPLVSIKTFSSLLKEHGNDPEFKNSFLQVMDRDVARIGAIIDSVAAFAENHQVAFAPVDLREVLRSVADITADERRPAAIGFTWAQETPTQVVGNFGQLVQVFINLVQNATHALEGRPSPRIAVTCRAEATSAGHWLRVEVDDNGCGIESPMVSRIFDPFFSTNATGGDGARRGMGLGLAIVKRIIDGHRGQIGVDSQPGKGTRFTILLPVPETPTEILA